MADAAATAAATLVAYQLSADDKTARTTFEAECNAQRNTFAPLRLPVYALHTPLLLTLSLFIEKALRAPVNNAAASRAA